MARTNLPSLFSDFHRIAAFGGMRREFDDLLGRIGISDALTPMPAIDVVRGETAITVTANLPGLSPDAIDVSVTGEALHIVGEITEESDRTEGDVVLSERHRGGFSRTIPLGFEPAEDAIETKLSAGLMTITVAVPAAAAPKSRKVEIETG